MKILFNKRCIAELGSVACVLFLTVEINCNEESITFDFVFPTTNVGNVGFGDDVKLGITGTEAVLQIVREIIVGFHWEEDALGRSKQSYRSAHEALQKNHLLAQITFNR